MNSLIAALGSDIKPRSRDKWIARCPCHGDKDFAMSVEQAADGSVIAHCFACGANGLDLYKYLNLDLKELFGGKHQDTIPNNVRDDLSNDKFFIAIYESDIKNGIKPTWSEKKRYKLAKARILGIKEKWGLA